MIETILAHFPFPSYALTLVYDPDQLLSDETALATLRERGFILLQELEPIELRFRVEQERPFTLWQPLIIITSNPLNTLPYNLWQQGHHVDLRLSDFFPNVSLPVIRTLTSEQRWQLSQHPALQRKLGRQATLQHVLQTVFVVDINQLQQPAKLIAWFNQYHQRQEPMSPLLQEHLLKQLRSQPVYNEWPLTELLNNRDAFKQFIDNQWRAYLQEETGEKLLGEIVVSYHLPFADDIQLQDTVSSLVRSHVLDPVTLKQVDNLASWTTTAVYQLNEDPIPRQLSESLAALAEAGSELESARWPQWQTIADLWAEATIYRYHPEATHTKEIRQEFEQWQDQLDIYFRKWLEARYAALAVQKLPQPHHLYHVPHFINHTWKRQTGFALLIMDGMSLANWHLMKSTWQSRNQSWSFSEQQLLAQIPTITAVSRQALVSGLRPADFSETIAHNRDEKKLWQQFWERQDLSPNLCYYGRLNLENQPPSELTDSRKNILCLIVNDVDDNMVHKAGLGMADSQSTLRVWLKEDSLALEGIIDTLLQRDFSIYLTSDHGHTSAIGMGQSSEGRLLVDSRSKRARLYSDPLQAQHVQVDFPGNNFMAAGWALTN